MTLTRRLVPAIIAAAGLAVDAYVHLDLAMNYDQNKTGTLSQGTLFRVEAATAIVVAILVLLRPRRDTAVLVVAVAGSALAALLIYRYIDVKAFGPFPSMYEPIWFAEKNWSGVGEAVAVLAGAGLFLMPAPAEV